jgi:hypothetical protein
MAHAKLRRQVRLTTDLLRVLGLCLSLVPSMASASIATTPASVAVPGPAFNGVSLKVLTSSALPGGVIQLIAALTEPTPIVTSSVSLSFTDPAAALGPVMGVQLFGAGGSSSEVAGAAVIRDHQLTIRATSPSGVFGTDAGVPIISVIVAVRPDARLGADGTVAVDPAQSLWVGPSGRPYAQLVKNGGFEIGGTLSISDVLPAHGVLPAGSTVTVRGIGFRPGAVVDVDDVLVSSVRFVSDTELEATIAEPADMYGRKVRVRNPGLAPATFQAYLRAAWLPPSARPLLAATDPIFSPRTFSSATFTNSAAAGQFLALAMQNPGDVSASVTVELHSAAAGPIASAGLTLPPKTRISREVTELFGATAVPADGSLVVGSSVPVQMLGLIGDDAAGSVAPLTPAVARP